jgi:hypothetical protein
MFEFLVFLVLVAAALVATRHERTPETQATNRAAEAAIKTVYRVATKRARAASIPMPIMFEPTPVHGTPLPASVAQPTPIPGTPRVQARAASQPYVQHKRRKGNLKILKP